MADKPDMVPARSWRDHFRVDDKILKAFWEEFQESSPLRASELSFAKASSSVEFVLWCVREGHFSEEDFTRYQSEAFNLPVIRSDFFSSPTDHDFWMRVKDLHPWSVSCLPLTEWDGHLLIGSVWPEETFKTSLRHRLVLATPSNLRAHYDHFQTKTSAAPFTMPSATITPPPLKIEKPAVLEPKVSTSPSPKFDPADPFAALSRELGLVPDAGDGDAHAEGGDALHDNHEAPEGFVMPEGLSFNKEELSRLGLDSSSSSAVEAPAEDQTKSDSQIQATADGGTVVHDFETGEGEVVPKRTNDFQASIDHKSATPISPLDALALELETSNDEVDLDATQPSIVNHDLPIEPPAPIFEKPRAKPAPPPGLVIPFAPVVSLGQPAMVKPPAPVVAMQEAPPTGPINGDVPKRPVAEATVVVSVDDPLPPPILEEVAPVKTPRRPLFEPGQGGAPTGPITGKIQPPTMRPASSFNQTSTGTRNRKLEATPVTSFFGMGGAAGPSLSKSRNPNDHSGRAVGVSKLNPIHLDQCTSVDEAGAQALLQACNIFETAMILLFKDGELQPWKWNDLFLSVKGERPDAIDLQDPSMFKVVFRTAKPYHGYVVTSTVNQKFFNEFYRGMLPKHATVIPVMIDGRMGGMLLCFTNSKIDYRQSLRLMERLSFDLARVFKSLRSSSSKAS